MMPISVRTVEDRNYLRWLIYGGPGTGKTTLAASAALDPALSPVLVANSDQGLNSIAGVFPGADIRVVDVTNPQTMIDLSRELIKPDNMRIPELQGIKTLIIDSLSNWREKLMSQVTEEAYIKETKASKANARATPYTAQIQDYGFVTTAITTTLDSLAATHINIIALSGEQVNETVVGTTSIINSVKPGINPALWNKVGHIFDFIWYATKRNNTHRLLVDEIQPYKIKTRNPLYLQALRDLTIEQWKDPQAQGYYLIGQPGQPVLPELYHLYLRSTNQEK